MKLMATNVSELNDWKSLQELQALNKEFEIESRLVAKKTKVYTTDLTWKDVARCTHVQANLSQAAEYAFLLGYKYLCFCKGIYEINGIWKDMHVVPIPEITEDDINEIL